MKLKSGEEVRDRYDSRLDPETIVILSEACEHIVSGGREFIEEEVDLGRSIGLANCVEINDGNRVVYARRPGRGRFTKFVLNRHGVLSQMATVILKRSDDGPYYFIVTGWIGPRAYPEPWDAYATPAAREFWETHALIWGSLPVCCYGCESVSSIADLHTDLGQIALCGSCRRGAIYPPIYFVTLDGWGGVRVPLLQY